MQSLGTLSIFLSLFHFQMDEATLWRQERVAMVRQIEARGVADSRVLAALRTVPRHEFVPPVVLPKAYEDTALPIGEGQTISQPYVVALMTELLQPRKEDRVLEIGSGSGYQAAVLAGLVKQVYSMEIHPALASSARQRLRRLQYKNVEVRQGDGYAGWPEQAPFDKIIVTAAPLDIPTRLVAQLKPGGRMVIPTGPASRQELMVIEKDERGKTKSRSVLPVLFVPMVKPPEPPAPPPAPPESLEVARGEVQRAQAQLARTREAFAAGAVVRKDVDASERAVADAQERLDRLANGTQRLTPAIAAEEVKRAEDRLERLRGDLDKVNVLAANGMAARLEVEKAQESVREASGFLDLARLRAQELDHEWELARRVQEWQARGGRFDDRILESLEKDYRRRFGQDLPISANGLTLTHAMMNFDHTGRTDVALPPDSAEGRWLVEQLTRRDIPFLVYREAVPGKATGAHIHLGLPSPRLREIK